MAQRQPGLPLRFLITLVVLLITTSGVEAGPIAVRQPESAVYGVLALRTIGGEVLAQGELIQSVRGHQVDSQLVFRFNDGSLFDERVVFTPKPRLLAMKLSSEGTDDFQVGAATRKATRWLVNLELGGMLGVLASIAGKDPPDLRYWIATAPLSPAFVKFEGPFYLNGPVWRIELSGPRWPAGSPRQ